MAKQTTRTRTSSVSHMVELAGPVSDRVQIRNVILVESVVRRHARCAGPPADLSLQVSIRTEAKKQERLVQVLPRFTLIGRGSADAAEELLRVEALFAVQYDMPSFDEIAKKNIDAFGQMNGVYNVWPYWREFVQNMTVRMGFPPLTIPVFRPLAGGVSERPKKSKMPRAVGASAPTRRVR